MKSCDHGLFISCKLYSEETLIEKMRRWYCYNCFYSVVKDIKKSTVYSVCVSWYFKFRLVRVPSQDIFILLIPYFKAPDGYLNTKE